MIHGSSMCAVVGIMSAVKTAVRPPRLEVDHLVAARVAAGPPHAHARRRSRDRPSNRSTRPPPAAARSPPAGNSRGCARADASHPPTRRAGRRSARCGNARPDLRRPRRAASRRRHDRNADATRARRRYRRCAARGPQASASGSRRRSMRVDVHALRVHLVADPGVDEQARRAGATSSGRVASWMRLRSSAGARRLPQRLGHDAEHRAAVEPEVAHRAAA